MQVVLKVVDLKPYNVKELAAIYGVTRHTMRLWLSAHKDKIGKKHGRLYTTLQVRIIFQVLGLTGTVAD